MVEMTVAGVTVDNHRRPVVVLKDGERILPIWIGGAEAFSIQSAMEKVDIGRPMTHDLIVYILKGFKSNIQRVQIYKLEASTYYANLLVEKEGTNSEKQVIKIDCRPSDAIAIAVRTSCPIFVADEVLEQGGQDAMQAMPEEEEDEEEFLEE